MKLYFVRHGESDANLKHVISNRESLFHLTSLGKQQAQMLAQDMHEINFDAIFCSPVLRACETADILSVSLGIPYQITDALREYDCGVLEEQSDEESWQTHRYYFHEWMLCRKYDACPEGGENFLDIQKRFIPFIQSLKDSGHENILLVGHGGLFLLMLPLILSNINNEFARELGIGHTQCIIASSTPDGFVCKQWGDVQF